jgi:hypothetical protein
MCYKFNLYGEKMKKLILGTLMATLTCQAYSYEVKNVCAKYQTNYSWSQTYSVQTQIFSGQELNQATGTYTKYNFAYYYAVIWWGPGQASIIQLSIYTPGMILFNTSGVDQTGVQWQLSDNNGYCF